MRQRLVYFVRCQRFVKIGFASDPYYRVNELRCMTPFELTIVGAQRGSILLERRVHQKFRALRHRGEWFRLSPELHNYIQQRAQGAAFRQMEAVAAIRRAASEDAMRKYNRLPLPRHFPNRVLVSRAGATKR